MKIVIQRGDVVTRKDIEELFSILHSHVNDKIGTFVVYASNDPHPSYYYNEKERTFGFHSPKSSNISKTDAQSDIAAHLLAALDLGHLPDKLSSSKLNNYMQIWRELCTNIT